MTKTLKPRILTTALLSLLMALSAATKAHSLPGIKVHQILAGKKGIALLDRPGSGTLAPQPGSPMPPGSRLRLGNDMRVVLDLGFGVFLVTAKGADIEVLQHGSYRGGTRWRFFLRSGYTSVFPRIKKFSNPNSALQVFTPAGMWQITGTQASVEVSVDKKTKAVTVSGEAKLSQTLPGSVEFIRKNRDNLNDIPDLNTITLPAGTGGLISSGKPPLGPFLVSKALKVSNIRRLRGIVQGQIDPFHSVSQVVRDPRKQSKDWERRPIPVTEDGQFMFKVGRPVISDAIYLEVENNLGDKRLEVLNRGNHPF